MDSEVESERENYCAFVSVCRRLLGWAVKAYGAATRKAIWSEEGGKYKDKEAASNWKRPLYLYIWSPLRFVSPLVYPHPYATSAYIPAQSQYMYTDTGPTSPSVTPRVLVPGEKATRFPILKS